MIDLDNIEEIKKIDKSNMLGSIEALPDQCQQAWDEVKNITIPSDYQQAKNIIVCGMGGSLLCTHILYSLYSDQLKIPLQFVNDYHLLSSTNPETLVLLSSYSGTTEEVLNCGNEAKKRGAKILGITISSSLSQFLTDNNLPGYIFTPKFNPSGQPRMGLGYTTIGQIALFNKCNFLKVADSDIYSMISFLKNENEKLQDAAKLIVTGLRDKIPIIIGSSFLSGNTHVLTNQLNENSKNFSAYFILPELNHHLLEGLGHPEAVKSLVFLFLNSDFYEDKIKKRLNLTKEIISKNNISVLEFKPDGDSKLKQVFSTLLFGAYVSFYLAICYDINPSLIPWVDYFKEQLKK